MATTQKRPAKTAQEPTKGKSQGLGLAKKPVKRGELTFQQRVFVAEYLKDRNGKQAAIRAGYNPHSAEMQASRLLSNEKVKEQVEKGISRTVEKIELSAERVLKEVARLAFFDPRKLLDADGKPKPINELDDDTAACLAGMDITEEFEGSGADRKFIGYTKKYKIADKNNALGMAMKHLGLFERDNEQKLNPLTELLKTMGSSSALPVVKGTD